MEQVALSAKRKRLPLDAAAIEHSTMVKRQRDELHIIIPTASPLDEGTIIAEKVSPSLFTPESDSLSALGLNFTPTDSPIDIVPINVAHRLPPPALLIPGLFFPETRVPRSLARRVFDECMQEYFESRKGVDQVMLFTRVAVGASEPASSSSLPPILIELLDAVRDLLHDQVPTETHNLLFPVTGSTDTAAPKQARQAIINLYKPGQGISLHVDLLTRFGDGIVGVSLGSGEEVSEEEHPAKEEQGSCVMHFSRASDAQAQLGYSAASASEPPQPADSYDLFLPARSIIVLSEDARYKWAHGIDGTTEDWVLPAVEAAHLPSEKERHSVEREAECFPRGIRMSITFRWLLSGAEIIGE